MLLLRIDFKNLSVLKILLFVETSEEVGAIFLGRTTFSLSLRKELREVVFGCCFLMCVWLNYVYIMYFFFNII